MTTYQYPKSWDEPWTPPDNITGELRERLMKANERTLAMTPAEKEAMYQAQRESFIRGMGPCEHGSYDWETCSECLTHHEGKDDA